MDGFNISKWKSFGGTSAAAPHVSGAVGLMMSYLNDTTSAQVYKNMAPEDCEAIIQMTATDTDSLGYDQLTGYGRLNVGKALKKLQKPYHDLLHFGTNNYSSYSVKKSLYSSNIAVQLTERFKKPGTQTFIQTGIFNVTAYKITSTVYHNISLQDTIIASWPRPSSSVTWNLYAAISGTNYITPREKLKIVSCNNTSAVLEGYIYEVKLGSTPIGWWPVDTTYLQNYYGKWAEYSVLVRNYTQGTHTSLRTESLDVNGVSVYPNPTSGNQTLEVQTQKISDLSIDIYDIMGRKVKSGYSGKSEPSRTLITHDIGSLSNSLYIYSISIDGHITTRKFIKQ